ncbi:surfeit locus protein 1-like [Panonychus citri]|uniref:surfeit locus protein 1-like n=1 Tax=Panonychus citri TaxID=50023 RepID=UPI002307705A|nr:surfeit locus protein 1-like [Panonychus citri]
MFFRLFRLAHFSGLSSSKRGLTGRSQYFLKDGPKAIRPRDKPVVFGDYLLFAIPATTFCLGAWQVKRYMWKQDLKSQLKSQLSKEPVPLPEDLRAVDDMEYQRVILTGHFDHSKEQFIGPRVFLKESAIAVPSMLSGNINGFHVVTPFKLANRDYSVLINRGWVPKDRLDPSRRLEGQIEDEVTITGIVRKSEITDNYSGSKEANGIWLRRNIDHIAQECNSAPVMIDSDLESSVRGGPIGGQTRVELVDNHMSYIITWYTLTVILCYLCLKRIYVKKNPIQVS